MCENEPLLIDKKDFDCIAQVAKHCDWNQLCIYIREQQALYLIPKIGYCLYAKIETAIQDLENQSDEMKSLICGGTYTDCSGQINKHFGIKRVLIHASYASYIFRHGQVDTPFGVVQKMMNESVPVPTQELRGIKNEHYNNAQIYYEGVKAFICSIKKLDEFKDCFANDCGCNSCKNDCGCNKCNYCSNTKPITQRRGLTFKNITKK